MIRLLDREDIGPESAGERDEALRVVVVDDDAFARRAIRQALLSAGIVVVAEAQTGREAVDLTLFYRPDVVLMDMDLPDALAATQEIADAAPEQLVVLLTIEAEDEAAFAALQLGAAGVLRKDVDLDEALPRALHGAAAGEAVISRRLGMLLLQRLRHVPDVAGLRPVKGPLTQREWEVIDLLLDGHNTEDIARALVISTETVRSHVKNILRKLGARNRADAVLAAQRLRGAAADL